MSRLRNFPEGTKYIYGLNYKDNSPRGIQSTVDDALRVYDALGTNLYAFELGTEVQISAPC